MAHAKGFALISILLLATVMLILVMSMLHSSQLSLRIADLGQQQLISRQQAWMAHQQQLAADPAIPSAELDPRWCPARFAAWEGQQLHCSRQVLWSETASTPLFTERVGSIQLTIALNEELLHD
ncbi:MAG: hypothetical protein LAT66_05230 [Alkalimonas sp.]|nr:hypothetical protein [Alkalimonas sp.]